MGEFFLGYIVGGLVSVLAMAFFRGCDEKDDDDD